MRDLQGFSDVLASVSGGRAWYPYVNLDVRPDLSGWASFTASSRDPGRGFPCPKQQRSKGTEWQQGQGAREECREVESRSPKAARRQQLRRAKDITVLEGLEAVRKRPGMYIGSTGARGLHHLVYEVVDNSVDEAIAGHCDQVTVTLHPDNASPSSTTAAASRSTMHKKEKRPAAEVVLTTLHAGGKFGDGGGYKVSGGLHGVGVSVVNALSERLHLEVRRDGHVWTQDYERGKPTGRPARRATRPRRPGRRSPSCPTPRSSTRSSSTTRRSPSGCARPPS